MSHQAVPPAEVVARPRRRQRRPIASFDTYAEAQLVVDRLASRCFPVEYTAIVARDLSFTDASPDRRSQGRAAVDGARVGALVGFLFGLVAGVLRWTDGGVTIFALLVYGALSGATVGGLGALVLDVATSRNSPSLLEAGAFDLLVDEEWADDAALVLAS